MKKIIYKIRNPKPNRALSAMACFPYNREYVFSDDDEYHVLGVIESYLNGHTYIRRSAYVKLNETHAIKRDGNTIYVIPWSGIPILTIKIVDANSDEKIK